MRIGGKVGLKPLLLYRNWAFLPKLDFTPKRAPKTTPTSTAKGPFSKHDFNIWLTRSGCDEMQNARRQNGEQSAVRNTCIAQKLRSSWKLIIVCSPDGYLFSEERLAKKTISICPRKSGDASWPRRTYIKIIKLRIIFRLIILARGGGFECRKQFI